MKIGMIYLCLLYKYIVELSERIIICFLDYIEFYE